MYFSLPKSCLTDFFISKTHKELIYIYIYIYIVYVLVLGTNIFAYATSALITKPIAVLYSTLT